MNTYRAVIWLASGLALSATLWAAKIEPGPAGNAKATWSGQVLRFNTVKPGVWRVGPGSGRMDLNHLSLLTPVTKVQQAKVQQPSSDLLNERMPVKSAAEQVEPKAMAPADEHKAPVQTKATKAKPVRYPVAPVESKTEK